LGIVNEIEDDMAGRLKMAFNDLGENTQQNSGESEEVLDQLRRNDGCGDLREMM